MDTRFRFLGIDGLYPGQGPVSWPVDGTEDRLRLARQFRDEQEEQLFVFRTLEISNAAQTGAASRYSLKLSTFCIPQPVGTAAAKPRFVCELHSTR